MIPQTFLFFGPSGSGKGTQAKLLIDFLEKEKKREVVYIETGAKFREFMNGDSFTSQKTREVLDNGGLLPAFLPVWLWTDILVKEFTGKEDLVLDGLCRRLFEAPVLDSALKFYGRENPCIIYINVSRDWSRDRMKERGRSDDTEDYIKSRLDWFEENVVPAINYFRENPDYNFLEINGEQSIEKVHQDIIDVVKTNF